MPPESTAAPTNQPIGDLTDEPSTQRLRFRRPTPDDQQHADAFVAWQEYGIGPWICLDRETERTLGWCGFRPVPGQTARELDWAFGRDQADLEREAVRACATFATERLTDRPIAALVGPVDPTVPADSARERTATAAGFFPSADDPASWRLATFTRVLDPAPIRSELRDLWVRVNDAGGAVGFLGRASADAVEAELAGPLSAVCSGESILGTLRQPGSGQLLGMAFLEPVQRAVSQHIGWLKRVMVDPDHERRNLGMIVMAGMHALARDRGLEIIRLTYRGGRSLDAFYRRCGYEETGRVPGGVRFRTADQVIEFDDIEMAYRIDGQPLTR